MWINYIFRGLLSNLLDQTYRRFQDTKLRQLGLLNRIMDNSDSKPSRFDWRLRYESDSRDGFELTIAIFFKVNLFQCNFNILMKIRLKWFIKRSKKLIKRSKNSKLIKKADIYQLFWSLSITSNINLIYFEWIRTFWFIFEPLDSISLSWFSLGGQILIQKVE